MDISGLEYADLISNFEEFRSVAQIIELFYQIGFAATAIGREMITDFD